MKLDYKTQSPEQVVDQLLFCSYRANRSYGETPERLRLIFGKDVDALEAKYQREQGDLDEMQQRLASAYSTLHVSTREGL